jgi:hypothetical protein
MIQAEDEAKYLNSVGAQNSCGNFSAKVNANSWFGLIDRSA